MKPIATGFFTSSPENGEIEGRLISAYDGFEYFCTFSLAHAKIHKAQRQLPLTPGLGFRISANGTVYIDNYKWTKAEIEEAKQRVAKYSSIFESVL